MSDCYCDYEPLAWFEERFIRSARVIHPCHECGRKIFAGEPYVRASGCQDQRVWHYNQCEHCQRFRNWMAMSFDCWCNYYGGMWDDFQDWFEESRWEMLKDCPGLQFETLRRVHDCRKAREISRTGTRPPRPAFDLNKPLVRSRPTTVV